MDEFSLAVLLAHVRPPDHDYTFTFGTRRLTWVVASAAGRKQCVLQFNKSGFVYCDPDSASWIEPLSFPELLAKFSDPEYRRQYNLDP